MPVSPRPEQLQSLMQRAQAYGVYGASVGKIIAGLGGRIVWGGVPILRPSMCIGKPGLARQILINCLSAQQAQAQLQKQAGRG